ncbi:MAG TPA: hypothetical protein VH763_08580 [Gemmatimonadales bacterium]
MAPSASLTVRLVGLALLCGCAPATQSASSMAPHEPDCSFRSATTCWTFGGRFPSARSAEPDSDRKELLAPPTPLLAARTDSLPARR